MQINTDSLFCLPRISAISRSRLRALFRHGCCRSSRQTCRIVTQSDAGAVCVVRAGRLELLLSVTAGRSVRVRDVGPGEVVGLASAINRAPYCKTAIAIEETLLERFNASDVVEFLAGRPESQVQALTFLCADADAMQRVLAHAKSDERAHHIHTHT